MKPRTFSAEQLARIKIVWGYYKKSLKWPSWKTLINEHPAEFEHLPSGYSEDVHVNKDVSLDFETILAIPEAWQLLEPLPELLRLAARRFIEHPVFDLDEKALRPSIDQEDFSRIWHARDQMILAHILFDQSRINLGSTSSRGPSADKFRYDCSYAVLRYENVQHLKEALEIASHYGGVNVGAIPPEQHQRLMQAVLEHATRTGSWPVVLPFAIEHRRIGYLPQLVNDLRPNFILAEFRATKYDRIRLEIWALPFVDPSKKIRLLLPRLIRTLAQLWKKSPADRGDDDRVAISLVELSAALKMDPLEVAPAVLFLERERWIGGGTFDSYEQWRVSITTEIWQFRELTSWEDYLKARSDKYGVPHPLRSHVYPEPPKSQVKMDTRLVTSIPGSLDGIVGQLFLHNQEGFSLAQKNSPTAESRDSARGPETSPVDVAIICALRTPELEKVLNTGKAEWKKLPSDPSDPQTYHQGSYTTSAGTQLRVIAAAPNQMGPPAAAALAAKVIWRFRPRLVAMVGIAAGATVDPDGFGDILAPDTTFDYTSGKFVTTNGKVAFNPDPRPLHINSRLLSTLKDWQADGRGLFEIWRSWPGTTPSRPPKLIVGPLASGSSVVANREVANDVIIHWRKLIGLEMEAYAVHCACRDTTAPETPYLAFKSVCDFADGSKNDEWQPYAAYTAAESLHRFLVAEWENLHLPPVPTR